MWGTPKNLNFNCQKIFAPNKYEIGLLQHQQSLVTENNMHWPMSWNFNTWPFSMQPSGHLALFPWYYKLPGVIVHKSIGYSKDKLTSLRCGVRWLLCLVNSPKPEVILTPTNKTRLYMSLYSCLFICENNREITHVLLHAVAKSTRRAEALHLPGD